MVITWILNTVSDDISNSMNYMDSALDVWTELNDRFSVLKGLWDELRALKPVVKCTCGSTKDWEDQLQKKRLIQFLMGLHNSYTAARGNLLMMNHWPSVNQAYMLLKQEERQRQTHTTSTPLALMVNLPKQSQNQNKSSSGSLECSYCHGRNHTKDRCFKLVGYPLDHPYHPNNKGKKRPFTHKNAVATPKIDHAMQTATSGIANKASDIVVSDSVSDSA
ncbi:uncharacterized protein LOC141685223 [Apium graveolens]|uniref:uncharacterized protein LOC141685223 n=1 Tax=Apium graveolens TaxID=4045 RepID=UPI003D7BE2C9